MRGRTSSPPHHSVSPATCSRRGGECQDRAKHAHLRKPRHHEDQPVDRRILGGEEVPPEPDGAAQQRQLHKPVDRHVGQRQVIACRDVPYPQDRRRNRKGQGQAGPAAPAPGHCQKRRRHRHQKNVMQHPCRKQGRGKRTQGRNERDEHHRDSRQPGRLAAQQRRQPQSAARTAGSRFQLAQSSAGGGGCPQ
ncbi:hypothetical protein FIU89_09565 [Roseovarius sp. THAF27]|nr:hypothetical protein FIU89_09565 [Roseovarius sp. THAF27]